MYWRRCAHINSHTDLISVICYKYNWLGRLTIETARSSALQSEVPPAEILEHTNFSLASTFILSSLSHPSLRTQAPALGPYKMNWGPRHAPLLCRGACAVNRITASVAAQSVPPY